MTEQIERTEQTEQTPRADDPVVGPIDYLAVELPSARMNGEGLAALLDLVDRGIIRILDLSVAKVDADGSVTAVEITDLDGDGELDISVFAGVRSGLIDDEDLAESAGLIEPGNAVAVLLYENTWAGPFVAALRRSGADVVASGRIPADDVIALLDELDGPTD
jgi:hypothetical protein